MRCLLLSLMLLLLASGIAAAQTLEAPESPELTLSLEPARAARGGAYVQGQLRLQVRVISKHPFEALDLRLPDFGEARVVTLSKPRTRKVRSYAGDGYVFETALALFPQRSGPMRILPVTVAGAVAQPDGETSRFALQSDSLAIEIAPIAPGFRADWWLVAEQVTMSESWSKPLEALRVGDVVRREVLVTAAGVTAEQLPAIAHGRARGISVSDAGREAKTQLSAKGAIAELRQAWDLRIDSGEVIHVSPVRLAYWDPATRSERHAIVPAKRIEPLPRDGALLAHTLMAEALDAHARRQLGLTIAVALPAALLLLAALAVAWTALPTRSDRALRKACTAGVHLTDCYRAILAWQSGLGSRAAGRSLGGLGQELGGAAVGKLDELQAALFSARPADLDPKKIAAALLSAARRRRVAALRDRLTRIATCTLGDAMIITRTIPKS